VQALGLKAGTVYPILMGLTERGQVETTWETDPPSGRPARHLYRLSGEGARFAEELRAAAAAEILRASRSGGVIRPAPGEAVR
jgi:PadR family transcriptional regulator PadR